MDERFMTLISVYLKNKEKSTVLSFGLLEELPIWIIAQTMQVTELTPSDFTTEKANAQYSQLLTKFENCKIKASELSFIEVSISCDLSIFNGIAQRLQPQLLKISTSRNAVITNSKEMTQFENVDTVVLFGNVSYDVICDLKVETLEINCSFALAKEEWKAYIQNPSARHLQFSLGTPLSYEDSSLLGDIPHCLLWTKENHLSSQLSDICPQRIQSAISGSAYIISHRASHFLYTKTQDHFRLDKLTGDTPEKIEADGWKTLRNHMEYEFGY